MNKIETCLEKIKDAVKEMLISTVSEAEMLGCIAILAKRFPEVGTSAIEEALEEKKMANLNLNKVIIGGRVCADIELKTTSSGISVTSFTVAVNRKGKSGDEVKADFISCQAWRGTAEFISKYFSKGSSICIVGSLQTRSWTDNNGNKRYATEVVVDEANFVDSKSDSSAAPTQPAPTPYIPDAYLSFDAPKFEEIDDPDLPF